MKVIVIGGVAAGTKAAAKLKREDRSAEVKILTKSEDISYAGCGLPYYVSGVIGSRDELIVNTPQKYKGLTGAEVVTGCEVVAVDAKAKKVRAVKGGAELEESYDKLIVAVGAFFNAGISFLSQLYPDALSSYAAFSAGGFRDVYAEDLYIPAAMILAGLVLAEGLSPRLNLLCLGDDIAQALGVRVKLLRFLSLLLASLLCGAAVSFAER